MTVDNVGCHCRNFIGCFMGENPHLQQIIASTSGALITATVMCPFDVVKTRAQTGQKVMGSSSSIAVTRQIVKTNGVRALWRGLSPTLASAIPSCVAYLSSYEYLKASLENGGKSASFAAFTAGALSRTFATCITAPLEYVRTAIMASEAQQSAVKVAQMAIQSGGKKALFRGLGLTLVRDVPFSACYWLVYERLKASLRGDGGVLISASVAGTVAALVTTPVDVMKTRVQSELHTKNTAATTELAMKLLQGGVRQWFAGVGPRVLKVAPSCALMLGTYEALKEFSTFRPDCCD